MSRIFWAHDNGRWMIATSKDFELPADRIVEVHTKGQGFKRMRLAVEPSCESIDKYGNPILLWGKSDIATTHGKSLSKRGLKGRMS